MRKDQVAAAARALAEYDHWSSTYGRLEQLVRDPRLDEDDRELIPPPGYLFLPGDLASAALDTEGLFRGIPIPAEDCLAFVRRKLDAARQALSVEFGIYVDR